jgi:hypothetical protein
MGLIIPDEIVDFGRMPTGNERVGETSFFGVIEKVEV